MSGTVVHLGPDTCHRLRIVASAGYSVYDCDTLQELEAALGGDVSAVVLTTGTGALASAAISLTRSRTWVPLILFGDTDEDEDGSGFDLYVPAFTRPQDWIGRVTELIEQSRASRSQGDTGEGTEQMRSRASAGQGAREQVQHPGPERELDGEPSGESWSQRHGA